MEFIVTLLIGEHVIESVQITFVRICARNLLFFGHFADMTEDEYMGAMSHILQSDELLYETAIRDIHSLGTYLHRKKYRFLRFAYLALISGFVIATGVEIWALIH